MTVLLILVLLAAAIGGGFLLFTMRTVRQVEAALPPAGRFVDVPGARLHLVERGQGPALLLVHGLAGQLGHFTYGIVDQLATQYRVVAVDRPGSGYSVRLPGAQLTLVDGGHMLPITAPARTAQFIREAAARALA